MIVLADQAKILGSSAPGTLLGWVAVLFGVWGSLTALVGLISAFASVITRREKLFSKFAGAVLPLGWLVWGAALLHADPTPGRIAIVAGGAVAIFVGGGILWRFFRNDGSGG